MAGPKYNSWRFTHPESPDDSPKGLRLSQGIEMIDGVESVRQGILILLSTIPGERVGRPDYGCDLHQLVFSPNDETTAGLAMHYVRRALERWEPRIDIIKLDAGQNEDRAEQLDITLVYRVKVTLQTETLTMPLDLMGDNR